MYHVYLWKKHNGKVPRGKIVVFRDRNPMNCVLENLELITRGEALERARQTDEYIAMTLSHTKGARGKFNREMYQYLLQQGQSLIELKRQHLLLRNQIKERNSNGKV